MMRSIVSTLSVLIIFSLGESSRVSSDKFVSMKGNMNASKVYATQAAFGDVSTKSMYSSLRLRANSLEASKVSTIETVTPLIKVPKDSNGDLVLEGYVSVTGSIEYQSSKMKYNPGSSFLETDERINLKDDIWRPVLSDRFEHDASVDWSFGSNEVAGVTHCGDKNYFLGGHCVASDREISKTVSLPMPHDQLHLSSVFHFLDLWKGESGYLKIDGDVVWTDTHRSVPMASEFVLPSSCAHSEYADTKMGSKIDLFIPHQASEVTISFGSSLASDRDPCHASWGVDDIEVSVR